MTLSWMLKAVLMMTVLLQIYVRLGNPTRVHFNTTFNTLLVANPATVDGDASGWELLAHLLNAID